MPLKHSEGIQRALEHLRHSGTRVISVLEAYYLANSRRGYQCYEVWKIQSKNETITAKLLIAASVTHGYLKSIFQFLTLSRDRKKHFFLLFCFLQTQQKVL